SITQPQTSNLRRSNMTYPAAALLKLRITAIILLLIGSGQAPLVAVRAQSASGTLEGYVHDAAGNPVFNAKVVIINDESGNLRATRTDANGYYRMPFLPPGGY